MSSTENVQKSVEKSDVDKTKALKISICSMLHRIRSLRRLLKNMLKNAQKGPIF
jgi:hypothetical protein